LNDSGTAGKNLSVSRGSASYNNLIFYKGSNSAYFDNNTYLENTTISLAVPITLSLWLYVINKSAMHTALALTVGSTVAINLDIEHFDTNYCVPNVVVALNTQWLQPIPKINVLYNTWHNYIITIGVDSGGTNAVMRFYLNGLLVTSLTGTSPNFNVNPTRIIVGTNGETQTRSFIGYINDLRIYTTALNYSQVLRLYNDSLVYYNRPYPTLLDNNSNIINPYLWYKFENNLNDSGTAAKNLSVSRSSISYNQTIFYRNGISSLYFDSTNNPYFTNYNINIPNPPITISLWIYVMRAATFQTLIGLANASMTVAYHLDLEEINTTDVKVKVVIAINQQWLDLANIPSATLKFNSWFLYTVTVQVDSGNTNATMRFYINNNLITTVLGSSPNFNVGITRLILGTNADGVFNRNFTGYISDFRIYNVALTQAQIQQLTSITGNIRYFQPRLPAGPTIGVGIGSTGNYGTLARGGDGGSVNYI